MAVNPLANLSGGQRLPPLACDCHVHVMGPRLAYPMVEERHYTPGEASVAALQQHMARMGLGRAVIVQPSVYGVDNTCLLDALKAMNGAARAVAVLAETVGDAELDALNAAGVRGVRLNVESASQQDSQALYDALRYWAVRVAPWGWHLQIYASLQVIAHLALQLAPRLGAVPTPLVFDHFAMIPQGTPVQDAELQQVLNLLKTGNVWVKLSAAYRLGATGTSTQRVADIAHRLIDTHSQRILWGSDWPHTNREAGKSAHQTSAYRSVASAALLGELHTWLPDPQTRQQVLVTNPATLYGF